MRLLMLDAWPTMRFVDVERLAYYEFFFIMWDAWPPMRFVGKGCLAYYEVC